MPWFKARMATCTERVILEGPAAEPRFSKSPLKERSRRSTILVSRQGVRQPARVDWFRLLTVTCMEQLHKGESIVPGRMRDGLQITPGGTFTPIYDFCAQTDCPAGTPYPVGALVQATNGYLYGTTNSGGAYGEGSVYKITPNGTLTTLYSFCADANCSDGGKPTAGLVQATDGNLYGTATWGGLYGPGSVGTIFKVTPEGTLTTITISARVDVPMANTLRLG